MHILNIQDLRAPDLMPLLPFESTADLLSNAPDFQAQWFAQTQAKETAFFGLRMPAAGFHLLVLGAQGSGRTSLMRAAMHAVAREQFNAPALQDLIALHDFNQVDARIIHAFPAGFGKHLRAEMEAFSQALIQALPQWAQAKAAEDLLAQAQTWCEKTLHNLQENCQQELHEDLDKAQLKQYLSLCQYEILTFLKAWQTAAIADSENAQEGLLNEALFARLRVNVLVDNAQNLAQKTQPLMMEIDPSLQSLFGGVESTNDYQTNPEFARLKAGSLHKANGGMLLLHLRDLLADDNSGAQILEKLHRYLRNGSLQIEDSAAQGASVGLPQTITPLKVKLVLVATREDYYDCLDQVPDFFEYFLVKVDFVERVAANAENVQAIAHFVAYKALQHGCKHFSAAAVAALVQAMQRLEEDQYRISTSFAKIEQLMLESAAFAGENELVQAHNVQQALAARQMRNRYFENQIRDSIIDNELLIQVRGEVVGQVNGLTHIELGDASFGSPIRITARCYPGRKGLINIDREVNMSGPNHDKGIFILQNWLNASFSHLAPLSLNASLVFEQEYNGVEGDSASCAELFALLSALAGLPIRQGIAVTGALNQFGEVMPIGGVNEKIEGYFRVCQALGLDGKQGVMIPKRNQRHLLLDEEVVAAVKTGKFQIIAIEHVLEGIAFLTEKAAEKVLENADATLASYRKTLEMNQQNIEKNIQNQKLNDF